MSVIDGEIESRIDLKRVSQLKVWLSDVSKDSKTQAGAAKPVKMSDGSCISTNFDGAK